MSQYHAAVWIDHAEARVFQFDVDHVEKTIVHPDQPHKKLHHKAGAVGSGNTAEDRHFYQSVVEALEGAHEILILGPGQAKLQLVKYVHKFQPKLEEFIVGVESSDHPTDGQIVAYARKYFKKADMMLSQM